MSKPMLLVTGATGETGRYTVRHSLEKGHTVRAMVHKEDQGLQGSRLNKQQISLDLSATNDGSCAGWHDRLD